MVSKDFDRRLQLGGMAVSDSVAILLERPWYKVADECRLLTCDNGEYLTWNHLVDYARYPQSPRPRRLGTDCLNDFLAFADPEYPSEEICRFAERYGVLNVCRHNEAWRDGRIAPKSQAVCSACLEESGLKGAETWLEPIATWRTYAAQMNAIISLALDIWTAGEQPTRVEDWEALRLSRRWVKPGDYPSGRAAWPPHHKAIEIWVEDAMASDAFVLRTTLKQRDISGPPTLDFTIWPNNVLGWLTLALIATLESPLGPQRCDFCHISYSAIEDKRSPDRSGSRKHYCPKCRSDDYAVIRRWRQRERYAQKNPEIRPARKDRGPNART